MNDQTAILSGSNLKKPKFIIYCPPIRPDAGGVLALYELASKLIALGCDVKLWPSNVCFNLFDFRGMYWLLRKSLKLQFRQIYIAYTWYREGTPNGIPVALAGDILNSVVLYTETTNGNPLNAGRIARWILYYPGKLSVKRPKYEYASEKFFLYNRQFANRFIPQNAPLLRLGFVNSKYYKAVNFEPRTETAVLIRKGRKTSQTLHPKNSIVIDGMGHAQINEVFNKCKFLYSYDADTAYLLFASLSGCIPIIVSPEIDQLKSKLLNQPGYAAVAFGEQDVARVANSQETALRFVESVGNDERALIENFIHEFYPKFVFDSVK